MMGSFKKIKRILILSLVFVLSLSFNNYLLASKENAKDLQDSDIKYLSRGIADLSESLEKLRKEIAEYGDKIVIGKEQIEQLDSQLTELWCKYSE